MENKMENNEELYNAMASEIVRYNQSKALAETSGKRGISNFYNQQVVFYCSGIYLAGHFDGVMKSFEEMKQNANSEVLAHIDQSIKDLQTEAYVNKFVSKGLVMSASENDDNLTESMPVTQEEQKKSYAILKENANSIPDEFVEPASQNLQTKLNMPNMFSHQAPLISIALTALNDYKFCNLTDTPVQ